MTVGTTVGLDVGRDEFDVGCGVFEIAVVGLPDDGDSVRPISGFNVGAREFFTDGVDVGCSGVAGLVVAIVDGG